MIAIASRYRQPNIELADLIGAGHLGLHAAIARFDSERFEGRLATYAIGWIRWHIQDYIRRNAAPVRLPATAAHRQLAQMAGRLFADARKSCQREHVEATEAELCERIGRRIGMAGDEVARSIRLISGGTVSLHAQVTAAEPRGTWRTRSPTDGPRRKRTSFSAWTMPRRASGSWRWCRRSSANANATVFSARCMGDGDEIAHLETLAERFGVTRERVCQLEASAKRKIATALAQEGYADFAGDGPITLPQTPCAPPDAAAQQVRPIAAARLITAASEACNSRRSPGHAGRRRWPRRRRQNRRCARARIWPCFSAFGEDRLMVRRITSGIRC